MANTSADDTELRTLMRTAQQGDTLAYAELLHRITPMLRGFIRNRLGFTDERDDLVQEILLAIHQSGHTYNTDRAFKPWMFSIAHYKLSDWLRRYYRENARARVDFANLDTMLELSVTDAPSPAEMLEELLACLPERQRQIVFMMKIEGHTAQDVAKALDMSESAVKVAAHRAYKHLIATHQEDAL